MAQELKSKTSNNIDLSQDNLINYLVKNIHDMYTDCIKLQNDELFPKSKKIIKDSAKWDLMKK